MNLKYFEGENGFLNSIEALKRGHTNAAKEQLQRISPSDEALILLERGNIKGAINSLTIRTETELPLLAALEARGSYDSPAYQEYYGKVSKVFSGGTKGGLVLKNNSPALAPRNQQKAFYSTSTSGGNLIATDVRIDQMEFKNRTPLFRRLGMTVIDDLEFNKKYQVPIETVPIPAYDLLEGTPLGGVEDPEFQELQLVDPKTIFVQFNYSRRLSFLISEETNEMFKDRLNDSVFSAIDRRLFYGLVASHQCEGLYSHSGLQKVAGASFDESTAHSMIKKVNENEAVKEGRFFVLNAALEEKLKNRPYSSNVGRTIIEKGLLCDQAYEVSDKITDNHIWYGAWSTVAVMLYPREILFDVFTQSREGGILVKQWQLYDRAVRNINWVSMSDDVS